VLLSFFHLTLFFFNQSNRYYFFTDDDTSATSFNSNNNATPQNYLEIVEKLRSRIPCSSPATMGKVQDMLYKSFERENVKEVVEEGVRREVIVRVRRVSKEVEE